MIRLGFEPEPGCIVETTPRATALLSNVDHDYLGLCLDACHMAVGFEEPGAGTRTAPHREAPGVMRPGGPAGHSRRWPRSTRPGSSTRRSATGYADDLGEALAAACPRMRAGGCTHVPLHDAPPPPLTTSAPYLRDLLDTLLGGPNPLTRHVEVETYTWNVLPSAPADVAEGIAAELDWMRGQLAALGLKET